jgi:hypothetical protein
LRDESIASKTNYWQQVAGKAEKQRQRQQTGKNIDEN